MAKITVPEVGESITEGLLVEWHVEDGAYVEADTPLFDVETDKVTVTVNAETAGVVKIDVGAGTEVDIGQAVGQLDTSAARPAAADRAEQPAEKAKSQRAEGTKARNASGATATATATATTTEAARHDGDGRQATPRDDGMSTATHRLDAEAAPVDGAGEEPEVPALPETAVSPTVRAFIRQNGLDAREIRGTGPQGRITLDDAQRVLDSRMKQAPAAKGLAQPVGARPAEAGPRQTRRKMTPIRRRIAERLVDAKNTTAMLTTFNEVDMTGAMAMRATYKDVFEKRYGVKLGFMSIFVKAAIDALKSVPAVNAFIDDTEIVQNHYFDIGIAVSTEKGLVVPVIRDADTLGFSEVELAIADLAKRARDRKLDLSDLSGGVFSITNGGIFGSLISTPILNPPQSAILGMHAIKKRPIVVDEGTPNERIEARPMMYLALSYDHRLVDGAEAVTFLKRICECVADPQRMMLQV